MNIFESLGYEHQLISDALQFARAYARRMTYPGAVAGPDGQALAGFCRSFISQCHQAKEFNLFVRLLQKGHSEVIAPITGLHADHHRLDELAAALDAAWQCVQEGRAGAYELMAGQLTDYAALMQAHMQKEERFYLVIESSLTPDEQAELAATFGQLDQETLGTGGHTRCCQWACQLASTAS